MSPQVKITNAQVLAFVALLIMIFLFWYFIDEGERQLMIKHLAGKYLIDTVDCDYQNLKDPSLKNVSMVLQNDGTFHFSPNAKALAGYEGTWSISHDPEIANYVFNCANGRYQINNKLAINVEFKNRYYQLCFKEKTAL